MDSGVELAKYGVWRLNLLKPVKQSSVEMASWRTCINEAMAESERAQHVAAEKVGMLEQQLESEHVQVELAHLHALKGLCALVIQREKDAMDEE